MVQVMVKDRRVSVDFWLGTVFFGLLLWMAWDYFFERVGFQDSAGYTVEMVKFNWFAFVHDRIGAGLSQVIPVVLLHFKAPLKVVMIGYSLNFVLLYFGCWWFCLSVCRHRAAAYAVAFLLVFHAGYTFFWPVTELLQSAVFSVVFFAWWNGGHKRSALVYWAVAILLAVLVMRMHVLGGALLLLVMVYDFLDRPFRPLKTRFLRLSLSLIPLWYMLIVQSDSPYEKDRFRAAASNGDLVYFLEELPITLMMQEHFSGAYKMLPIGLGLLVLTLVWKGKWLKLGLILGFHASYLLLIAITFPWGFTVLNLENFMYPIVFCQVLFLAHELLVPHSRLFLPPIALVFLALVFWFRIGDQSRIYQIKMDHYDAMANNLSGFEEGKFLMSHYNYPHDIVMMTWPSFSESLLYSALDGPDGAFSFYVANETDYEWMSKVEPAEELLLDYPWDPMGSQLELPRHYFNLPALPYRITNAAPIVMGDSMLTLLSRTSIEWVAPISGFTASTKPYCKVRFRNEGPDPVPGSRTGDTSVFLTYRFYFKGEMVEWYPEEKIPLLMDIHEQMEQLVRIDVPEQKEDIELQFGLVGYNGHKMYLTSPKYPIRIF